MERKKLIPANILCDSYNIEFSFIHLLHENGLIEIITIEETGYIPKTQLPELERIIRLYRELGINIEGIEIIINLLHRINEMQNEITTLNNKMHLYENFLI